MENFSLTSPQTSRTLLFGKYNDEGSLIDLLAEQFGEFGEQRVEDALKNIRERFEVHSFTEFLEKFPPMIYQSCTLASGKPVFAYSEKNTPGSVPIRLEKQQFYKMVQELIRRKEQGGESNLNAAYSVIDQLLSPKKAREDAEKKRKMLDSLQTKMLEAKKAHRSVEAKKHEKKFALLMQEVKETYEHNAVAMLPLAIADKQSKLTENIKLLKLTEQKIDEGQTLVSEDDSAPKLLTGGTFVWGESGRLEYQAAPENPGDTGTMPGMLTTAQEDPLYLEMKELADEMPSIQQSEDMKMVFIESFSKKQYPVAKVTEETVSQELQELQVLADNYKQSQESFIKAVADLMQRVLDVEMYFKHATQGLDSPIMPEESALIVVNGNLEEVASGENADYFDKYLTQVNGKRQEKVWFAILPPLEFDDIRWRFTGDAGNVKGVTDILAKHKIISFMSFVVNEEYNTGFSGFKGTENYKKILNNSGINMTYTSLCYPNFTVIPLEETDRKIVDHIEYNGDAIDEELEYINVNAVYVHAAFVAAGLVTASQNPGLLKSKKFKIQEKYTCAHFDLEKEYVKFLTLFNMENYLGWSEKFKRELRSNPIGICFSSDDQIVDGKPLRSCYLFHVRNNAGEPLYKWLIEQVVTQYFQIQNLTASQIETKVEEINDTLKKHCKPVEYDNVLLRADRGEMLEFKGSKNRVAKVGIVFGKNDETVSVDVGLSDANAD